MNKSRIYITGISGTGKSTIANELNNKGIYSISIDEVPDLCFWINKKSGAKIEHEAELNKKFIEKHDWVCDTKYLKKLISKKNDLIVVLGMASNQNDYLNIFDKTLLLQCKPETFINRIMSREDNTFGKDKTAQDLILNSYKDFESELLKNGAISINAEESINEVIEQVIHHIK